MDITVQQIGEFIWQVNYPDGSKRYIFGQFNDRAEVYCFAVEHGYIKERN